MAYPYVMTERSVAITIDRKTYNFTDSHPHWASIRSAIRNRKWLRVEALVDIVRAMRKFTHGQIQFKNGEVFFREKPLHNVVTDRIIRLQHEGEKFKPLVRFLDKLMHNPSESAQAELYLFMEAANLPITPDGDFLAFKRVNDDYTSVHQSPDGTHVNNAVGKTVRMARGSCDADREKLCSEGLHICGAGYLPDYSGARVVICKINPKDVVSVPSDHGNEKARVCAYKVVGELGVDFTDADMTKALTRLKKAA
jgi:hypothetical protein